MYRLILAGIWIIITSGFLYFLQLAFDKEKNFFLFVFLIIAGSLAYDCLKSIIRYDPKRLKDASIVIKYTICSLVSLAFSLAFILLGAALYHWRIANEPAGKFIASFGFLISFILGLFFLTEAESRFKISNRNNI